MHRSAEAGVAAVPDGRVRCAVRSRKRQVVGLFASATLLSSFAAHAGLVTTAVDFSAASQSMWGPSGTAAGFDYTQSTSIALPFSLGSVAVGYSVAASTGQVTGSVNGNIRASFADSLAAPGSTSITLSYFGDSSGGRIDTTVGAHAQLTSSLASVGPNFTLDTGKTFTPQLDSLVQSTGTVDPVATVPLISLLVADAGVSMGVTQNNDFRAKGIDGTLFYQREGGGPLGMMAFALDTDAGSNLALDLTDAGIYHFWYADLDLANTFEASMDLDLNAYAHTVAGCGPFPYIQECYTSFTVVSPTVYDGSPFPLDFGRIARTGTAFSITVAEAHTSVPEPSTLALVAAALFGFGLLRSRRKG
jgi:hypothetical protein